MTNIKNKIQKLIGTLPSESGFKKRMRFHQGWWRTCVLVEEEGDHPVRKDEVVSNTITNGNINRKNFLTANIVRVVEQTIQERRATDSGIIEEDRLFNNLLSSQPLCFNFFGEFKIDTEFALQLLKQFWPELTTVKDVAFEFAPSENYTKDNSAFDVAFKVMAGNLRGLIGLECKYTDSFSTKEYDQPEYRNIYEHSQKTMFSAEYAIFKTGRFN
jgi:hypothetical protein